MKQEVLGSNHYSGRRFLLIRSSVARPIDFLNDKKMKKKKKR